jgi:hypothetical protein
MFNKYIVSVVIAVSINLAGCSLEGLRPSEPEIVGPEPEPWFVLSRDSLSTAGYLGIEIGEPGANVYESIRDLQGVTGISHLNIVSNQTSDVASLADRIPLYSYILLDEQIGTDSGVQITLNKGAVSSIYLNSGKKISRWPEKGKTSLREGDKAGELHSKMMTISKDRTHARKFERVSLATKDLSLAFDPAMAATPQWYFAYITDEGHLELIEVHLKDGKTSHLIVTRQTKDWRELQPGTSL